MTSPVKVGGQVQTADGFFARVVDVQHSFDGAALLKLDISGLGLRHNVPLDQVSTRSELGAFRRSLFQRGIHALDRVQSKPAASLATTPTKVSEQTAAGGNHQLQSSVVQQPESPVKVYETVSPPTPATKAEEQAEGLQNWAARHSSGDWNQEAGATRRPLEDDLLDELSQEFASVKIGTNASTTQAPEIDQFSVQFASLNIRAITTDPEAGAAEPEPSPRNPLPSATSSLSDVIQCKASMLANYMKKRRDLFIGQRFFKLWQMTMFCAVQFAEGKRQEAETVDMLNKQHGEECRMLVKVINKLVALDLRAAPTPEKGREYIRYNSDDESYGPAMVNPGQEQLYSYQFVREPASPEPQLTSPVKNNLSPEALQYTKGTLLSEFGKHGHTDSVSPVSMSNSFCA